MPSANATIAALESYIQLTIADYIHTSATALLAYDTLLTMGQEVDYVWHGGFSGFAVLYCTNRYSPLLNRLMLVLERFRWVGQTEKSCGIVLWLDALFLIITWLSIAAFSALRVYALSGKRLWLLAVVLCFGLVLPAAEFYQRITLSVYVHKPPLVGCSGTNTIPLSTYRFLATGARASAIASDLLVLAVTLYQTHTQNHPSKSENVPSLNGLMYRDGSIYFAVLFLFNLCDTIFLQLAVNGALADMVTVLSVILVSRFLLHLREFGQREQRPNVVLSSVDISHSQFASAPLFHTLERSYDDALDQNV